MSAIAHAKMVFDRKTASTEIDLQSANAILTVAGSLNPDNRRKLDAMPVQRAAVIAWKLVSK
jgi:hypothetical protein